MLVNPADAAARGLTDGSAVRVYNDVGEFTARLEVSDRVQPGVVATTKGRWLKHTPGRATANAVVEERDADMGRGAVYHDNRVQIAAL